MKERIKELGYSLEYILKRCIGGSTPEKRLITFLILILIGTLTNLYITFKSVQALSGNAKRENTFRIDHISKPEIVKRNQIEQPKENDDEIPKVE